MLRRFGGLLLLCLVLTGCRQSSLPADSSVNSLPSTVRLSDYGCIIRNDLTCYPLESSDCQIFPAGNDLVLFQGSSEETHLFRYSGEELALVAESSLSLPFFINNPSIRVHPDSLSYYDYQKNQAILLDSSFHETDAWNLPEEMQGIPLLSKDAGTLYYCTSNGLNTFDTKNGSNRLLRKMPSYGMSVSSMLLDDTIIKCTLYPPGQEERFLYLNTRNGSILKNTIQPVTLSSWEKTFYTQIPCGQNSALLYGSENNQPSMLPLPQGWHLLGFFQKMGRAVIYRSSDFQYIDLRSGTILAEITISDVDHPHSFIACDDGALFFLNQDKLYRWCPTIEESLQQYISIPFYTEDTPDQDGLQECRQLAEMIGYKYGIQILTGLDITALQPWDYQLAPEYIVPFIQDELHALDTHLSRFPDGFLELLAKEIGPIKLCIVRSIDGITGSGALEAASGIQYAEGSNCCIALCAGTGAERALYHELSHLIDIRILNNSDVFDSWDNLNPTSFCYDLSYDSLSVLPRSEYLLPGTQAFIDRYSMTFPKEDRARIFECAMTDGHESLFASPVLQRKLRTICEGIRECFLLERFPSALPWEAYLDIPLYN